MPFDDGFYVPDPDLSQYYQGDILRNVPFPSWPTLRAGTEMQKMAVLRPLRPEGRPIDQLPSYLIARARRDVPDCFQNLLSKEFVVGSCQLRHVLILTRGCELDKKRNQAIVAPVTALGDLPEGERLPERLSKIRSGESTHKFFLPDGFGLSESFADLLKVTTIHRDLLPDEEVA